MSRPSHHATYYVDYQGDWIVFWSRENGVYVEHMQWLIPGTQLED